MDYREKGETYDYQLPSSECIKRTAMTYPKRCDAPFDARVQAVLMDELIEVIERAEYSRNNRQQAEQLEEIRNELCGWRSERER